MVARVYRPGCQSDHMVVLEGEQGIKKSSALREIGGPWFAEQHEAVTGRGFFEVLQGKLLIEISELDAFSRADVTKVKQVITCTNDRFRESYGRHAKDHPRQCVFVGTTNKDDWNRDETGARRFWPIGCKGEIDLDAIRANREQFFAEAVHRFKAGETWWEMPSQETQVQQNRRYVPPAWIDPIERYIVNESINDGGGFRWMQRPKPLTELSVSEVLQFALNIPESQWTKANEMRVAETLRYLRWTKKDVRRDGKVLKRWLLLPEGGDGAEGGNA
jgi:predicted P-loop ATPase